MENIGTTFIIDPFLSQINLFFLSPQMAIIILVEMKKISLERSVIRTTPYSRDLFFSYLDINSEKAAIGIISVKHMPAVNTIEWKNALTVLISNDIKTNKELNRKNTRIFNQTLSVFDITHEGYFVDTEFIFTEYFVDDGVVRISSFKWKTIIF